MNAHPGGRRRWLGITLLMLALGLVEVGVIAILGHQFLAPAIATALDVMGVAALAITVALAASVTWRTHDIDAAHVRLVLGYVAGITVARHCITEVTSLLPLTDVEADQIGPTFGDGNLVLTAASGIPRVRLRIDPPQPGRFLWRRASVASVVASDSDGTLLAALTEP